MTSSPSADAGTTCRRSIGRRIVLPGAVLASGLVIAVLAPTPQIADEMPETTPATASEPARAAEVDDPAVGAPVPLVETDRDPEAEPRPPVEAAAEPPPGEPSAGPAVPAVTVRWGGHPTFERFVFDWPEAVEVVTERTADGVLVHFASAARFGPDSSVPTGRFAVLADTTVSLRAPGITEVRSFALDDHRVVVDLYTTRPEARHHRPGPAAADEAGAALDPLEVVRAELYRRDLMIASLLARIEAVERGGPGSRGTALPPPFDLSADAPPSIIGAGTAAPAPAAGPDESGPAADPDEVERALERTLTRAGVLLLRPGQIEIEPALAYVRRETNSPVFVSSVDSGLVFIGDDRVERDEVRASLDLKVGLPFDSQVEVSVPFNYVDQSIKTMVGGTVGAAADGSGQAFGNPRFALAKTLAREAGWWPDLVLRGFWDTDFGTSSDNDIPLTSNFNELGLGLSAVKRQDPLAFVGGIGYSTVLEKNDIEPGDTLSLSVGAVLAASPSTSLRVAFSQQFTDDVKVDGRKLDGSDSTAGVLTIGAATTIGRRALLDVALDVGLNDDAADYAVRVALPIRFDLPLP